MSSEFEWYELIDRHLYGELNETEKERLAEWLDSDPAAPKTFVEQVHWDTQFSEALHGRGDSLLDPMLKQMATPISVEHTTASTSREQRPTRMIVKSLLAAGGLAAALLIFCSLLIALSRSQQEIDALKQELVSARQVTPPVETDESTIISIYAREHQDVVARHASLTSVQPKPKQIQVNEEDILYYELLDGRPDTLYPGFIVRGPSSQGHVSPSPDPVISNGHTLSLSEAKDITSFNVVAPLRLHPGFELDQIRRIEDRDALQLLYTNAIKSISLFEQPLDGQRGLEAKDFREYAVYRNAEQAAQTILAWKDQERSYVLIGDADMAQLMDMAQSISAAR